MSGYHACEGGGHGRERDIARAAIRGFLDALARLLRRLPYPDRGHRPHSHRDIWTELPPALGAGQDPLGRHPLPGRPAGRCRDPFLALPRRDAGKDAHLRENRRRQDVRAAVHGKADRSLFRLPRFDDPDIPGFPLDRLRQAQAGLARQARRNGGDLRRGRRLRPRSLEADARKGGDMGWGFWIVVGIVVAAVVWLISIYNGLVAQRNRFKNAFAQIDVQLKRRYDLIPNLVETAKGYIKHERGTLEAVIAARNGAQSANQRAAANPADAEAMKHMAAAEAGLSGALGRLFALFEAYPDLKANQTMMQLSEELTSTENKISFARQAYRRPRQRLFRVCRVSRPSPARRAHRTTARLRRRAAAARAHGARRGGGPVGAGKPGGERVSESALCTAQGGACRLRAPERSGNRGLDGRKHRQSVLRPPRSCARDARSDSRGDPRSRRARGRRASGALRAPLG